jgi:hypothetical protein
MRSIIIALGALAFATSASADCLPGQDCPPGGSYHLDARGVCHDAHGKFASAEHCRKPPPDCHKGKFCGDTCIPKGKVCHKDEHTVRDPTHH